VLAQQSAFASLAAGKQPVMSCLCALLPGQWDEWWLADLGTRSHLFRVTPLSGEKRMINSSKTKLQHKVTAGDAS